MTGLTASTLVALVMPVYGPMIGLETYTPKDYVKLGKLSASWVHEWNASFLVQVAD